MGGKISRKIQPTKSSSLIPPFKTVRSIPYIHPRGDETKRSWSSLGSGVSRTRSLYFCLLVHKTPEISDDNFSHKPRVHNAHSRHVLGIHHSVAWVTSTSICPRSASGNTTWKTRNQRVKPLSNTYILIKSLQLSDTSRIHHHISSTPLKSSHISKTKGNKSLRKKVKPKYFKVCNCTHTALHIWYINSDTRILKSCS